MLIHRIMFSIQLCRCSGGEETGDGLGRSVLRSGVLSTKGTTRKAFFMNLCSNHNLFYVNITEDSSIVFLQCWWILLTSELIAHLNYLDINQVSL